MNWYRDISAQEQRTLWGCFAGWALDGLDTQLFSLVIQTLLVSWGIAKGQAGLIGGATLVAGALGGLLAGVLSDRFGRVRALQITVVWFSLFTFLSAFAQNFEWGWRVLFGIGVLPALLVLYLRRNVVEPVQLAPATVNGTQQSGVISGIFDRATLRVTIVGALIGVGAHGGYHAITTWLPTYLKTERHLSVLGTGAYLAVVITAFICGCFVSAWLQDRIGRRRNVIFFAVCCMTMVNLYVFLPMSDTVMLLLSFPLGLFAAGIPATLGALFNELYPQGVRGTGVGFCYNFGRVVSAGFPVLIGHMGDSMPLGSALGIDAGIAYGLVVVAALMLPETSKIRIGAVAANARA